MTAWYLPRTEQQLEDLRVGGMLLEDHYRELKRELAPGKGVNQELARDLASLAVDGGALYIGVAEREGEPPELYEVELKGLAERVDQVARSAVSPPLVVQSVSIEAGSRHGFGYLVVQVPPSPDAPHMASGRYWGRGDVTKEPLADAQVRAVFDSRTRRREDAGRLLEVVVERDPTPSELRQQAHLFVLARPLYATNDLLLRAIGDEFGPKWLGEHLLHGRPVHAPLAAAPNWSYASTISRRASGWALHSYSVGESRTLHLTENGQLPEETGLLDIEIDEDGTLRLFCGRGTLSTDRGTRIAVDSLLAGLTRCVVVAAAVVASSGGYAGPWLLGLGVTNLRGAVSSHDRQNLMGNPVAYSEDEYRATTEAYSEELDSQPDVVVERLYGRLNRALTGGRFRWAVGPPR